MNTFQPLPDGDAPTGQLSDTSPMSDTAALSAVKKPKSAKRLVVTITAVATVIALGGGGAFWYGSAEAAKAEAAAAAEAAEAAAQAAAEQRETERLVLREAELAEAVTLITGTQAGAETILETLEVFNASLDAVFVQPAAHRGYLAAYDQLTNTIARERDGLARTNVTLVSSRNNSLAWQVDNTVAALRALAVSIISTANEHLDYFEYATSDVRDAVANARNALQAALDVNTGFSTDITGQHLVLQTELAGLPGSHEANQPVTAPVKPVKPNAPGVRGGESGDSGGGSGEWELIRGEGETYTPPPAVEERRPIIAPPDYVKYTVTAGRGGSYNEQKCAAHPDLTPRSAQIIRTGDTIHVPDGWTRWQGGNNQPLEYYYCTRPDGSIIIDSSSNAKDFYIWELEGSPR